MEVTDPTDWTNTPLKDLAPVDAALRCQICKDLYTSAMTTECAHTFCSLCIRRYLNTHQHCPLCRKVQQEMHLRKNGALQEAADAFKDVRSKLYDLARTWTTPLQPPPSTQSSQTSPHFASLPSSQQPARSSQRPQRSTRNKANYQQPPIEIHDSADEDGDFIDDPPAAAVEPDDGCVPCPVCHRRIPISKADRHVGQCLDGVASPPSPAHVRTQRPGPPPQPTTTTTTTTRPAPATPPADLNPLPKLAYSLLRETQLREKLRALGIPADGPKRLMQERHTEWLNIWNANVDSNRPRSKRELLRDLRTWEMAHVKPANNKTKAPEWDDQNWAQRHQGEFSDLVAKARESVNNKRRKVEEEEAEKTEGGEKDVAAVEVRDEPRIARREERVLGEEQPPPPASQPPPATRTELEALSIPRSASQPAQPMEKRKFATLEDSIPENAS